MKKIQKRAVLSHLVAVLSLNNFEDLRIDLDPSASPSFQATLLLILLITVCCNTVGIIFKKCILVPCPYHNLFMLQQSACNMKSSARLFSCISKESTLSDSIVKDTTEKWAANPYCVFNKLSKKPFLIDVCIWYLLTEVFAIYCIFTYDLNSFASGDADWKPEVIRWQLFLRYTIGSSTSARSIKKPRRASVFSFMSPFTVNSVQHCALNSAIRCRVFHCQLKHWAQMMQCTFTRSIGCTWEHWQRGKGPQYTTAVCILLELGQRTINTVAFISCTTVQALRDRQLHRNQSGLLCSHDLIHCFVQAPFGMPVQSPS